MCHSWVAKCLLINFIKGVLLQFSSVLPLSRGTRKREIKKEMVNVGAAVVEISLFLIPSMGQAQKTLDPKLDPKSDFIS